MVSVKVKNKEGIAGYVDVESWANPKTYLLDFVYENGDTMPIEKSNLVYVGIEEF